MILKYKKNIYRVLLVYIVFLMFLPAVFSHTSSDSIYKNEYTTTGGGSAVSDSSHTNTFALSQSVVGIVNATNNKTCFGLYCKISGNVTITLTKGNGSTVGTREYQYVDLEVTIYDANEDRYPENVSIKFWVEKSEGVWNSGYGCKTNSSGKCTYRFNPDCTYQNGWRIYRAGIFNDSTYADKNSTDGRIYIDTTERCSAKIEFVLEFNASSASADGRSSGKYYPGDIKDYYLCADLTNSASGIIFSGHQFWYANLSYSEDTKNYTMRMAQYQTNNRFIIPITSSCSIIKSKMPLIEEYRIMNQPFSGFKEAGKYPFEIMLQFPRTDIIGNFTGRGNLVLTMEKNNTQIIIRPK